MWLRALNVLSQITIIILALVIVVTMSKKQVIDSTFSSFEQKITARLDEDRKRLDDKVSTVQDNLNKYQLHREQRAQLFSERLDELYALYKKDPTPIVNANASAAKIVANTLDPAPEKNFIYLESKSNKIDEKLDNLDNKLSGRVSVLEQRVESLQKENKNATKVIQTNINNNSIGTVAR